MSILKPYNDGPLKGIAAPDKAQKLTPTAQNAIIDDGGTPTKVLTGDVVAIVRAVSTRTTNAAGIDNKDMMDIMTIRSLDFGNEFILNGQATKFFQAKKTDRIKLAIKSDVLERLRVLNDAEIWNYPESNDEVIVEDDLTNSNAVVVSIPAYVVPGLMNIYNKIRLIIR